MENLTIVLIPENASFKAKKLAIVSQPISLGRVLDGQDPNNNPPNWIRFNSKVVSRSHAKITASDGKFFIQDTKSSSGTFVNGSRLSPQGVESQLVELQDGDAIKLGEDYNQDGIVHLCVMFKVRLPGGKTEEDDMIDEEFGDTAMDNELKASVEANIDEEFNTIWNSLIADINVPLKKLRSGALLGSAGQSPSVSPARTLSNTTGSAASTQPGSARNDNTVTLIKVNQTSTVSTSSAQSDSTDNGKRDSSADITNDCLNFIQSLQWESNDLRDKLVDMVKNQDQQLLAFYKSLKGFPSSFMNVSSKPTTEGEQDPFERALRKSGCERENSSLQDCFYDNGKDWRKCTEALMALRNCIDKGRQNQSQQQ